ncbi:MAG: PTS sugar transporter subunit IIA [Chlorobiaceae bacterium]|nr:PTS sugar transporter subunit IIA [Chlorobiaceae bacterium]
MLKSILDALQRGRLVELPHTDKQGALQFLATLLEAIPSIPPGTGVVEAVMEHERVSITSLGSGWACPHARVNFDGDLSCAIGWSPGGIDYGIPGEPLVHMIVMFFVPDNQRNNYLKEVSSLARVLKSNPRYQSIEAFPDLNTARNNLLDLAHLAMNGDAPNARARMIRLEALTKGVQPVERLQLEGMEADSLTIVAGPGIEPIVLTQNQELSTLAGSDTGLAAAIANGKRYRLEDWQVVPKGSTAYVGERVVYDCIAIRVMRPQA